MPSDKKNPIAFLKSIRKITKETVEYTTWLFFQNFYSVKNSVCLFNKAWVN